MLRCVGLFDDLLACRTTSTLSWSRIRANLNILMCVLGPSWAILGSSWGHLGACWGHLEPCHLGASWGHLGANLEAISGAWGHLGVAWGHLDAILGFLGASLGPLGAKGWHLDAILGPCWGNLGANLKPTWGQKASGGSGSGVRALTSLIHVFREGLVRFLVNLTSKTSEHF